MKIIRTTLIYLLTLLSANILTSQTLTNKEMREFYPSNIGNSWSYRWIYYNQDLDYYEAGKDWVICSKDTMINNIHYKLIEYNYGGFNNEKYCERIDSITGNVLRISDFNNHEIDIVDNVYANVGDTIAISNNRFLLYCDKLVVLSIRDTLLNNFETSIRKVVGLPMTKKIFFAKGIGFLGSGKNYWIDSAYVDGIMFNNISNDITALEDIEHITNNFVLSQNYPNPFNPITTISYSLPKAGFVQLKIYDLLGKEVATLINKEQTKGNYKINFNASELSSGIYFYKLQSGHFSETKKLILLK